MNKQEQKIFFDLIERQRKILESSVEKEKSDLQKLIVLRGSEDMDQLIVFYYRLNQRHREKK